jgi:predicted phosphate transport protein (TIGR00153 family)
MANKSNRFYFDNFIAAADCSCRAAEYLVACLKNYKAEEILSMVESLHAIEHEADGVKHEMSSELARAFVTPIDREDLAMLSQNIDEVTDKLEEVLQRFYIDRVTAVMPEAIEFAEKIAAGCHQMKEMLEEFDNFKKSSRLHDMIVALNHAEEECDRLYLTAARSVREKGLDPLDVLAWREIYDCMEECADACEHVGDCVETVIMKNT